MSTHSGFLLHISKPYINIFFTFTHYLAITQAKSLMHIVECYQHLIQIGRRLDQTGAPFSARKVINMHALNSFFQLPSASTIVTLPIQMQKSKSSLPKELQGEISAT
jgi:hypothetical protein